MERSNNPHYKSTSCFGGDFDAVVVRECFLRFVLGFFLRFAFFLLFKYFLSNSKQINSAAFSLHVLWYTKNIKYP